MKKICSICIIILILVVGSRYADRVLTINKRGQTKVKQVRAIQYIKDIKPLNEDDFSIDYNGVKVLLGENPKKFFDKVGVGSAKEENNYGFIGWDSENENKMYLHIYTKEKPEFSITTKSNVISGKTIVNQINLISKKTIRNIGKGSKYTDIINAYGVPVEKEKNEINYFFKNKKLSFIMGVAKNVEQIHMIEGYNR